jgi:hypothetical protein
MTETEQKWLADIYENYIKQAHNRGIKVLHCDHWSRLVYQHVSALKYKIILVNDVHAVCCIDGILVDLELNAFIGDWGWVSSPIPPNAQCKPIFSKYPIIHSEIKIVYSKPATKLFAIGYKEHFLPTKNSHLNILT